MNRREEGWKRGYRQQVSRAYEDDQYARDAWSDPRGPGGREEAPYRDRPWFSAQQRRERWSGGPPHRADREFGDHPPYRSDQDGNRRGQGYSRFSQVPFARQPSGHAPFSHASFGESNPPRYFGAGSQGYGGGPSFTGGTYGVADERSDAPYFQEVGFNRGYYEDPFAGEPGGPRGYPYPRAFAEASPVRRRRYPMGPKGYQRSDERLREDISERLMEAYHIDSSEVTVRVLGGKVILEGTVPDRRMKHAIEDMAYAAPGVQDVENTIRVARGSGTSRPE